MLIGSVGICFDGAEALGDNRFEVLREASALQDLRFPAGFAISTN